MKIVHVPRCVEVISAIGCSKTLLGRCSLNYCDCHQSTLSTLSTAVDRVDRVDKLVARRQRPIIQSLMGKAGVKSRVELLSLFVDEFIDMGATK